MRALLKKFLPSGLRNQLHSLIKFLRFNLVKIFKRNGMLASFYYFFLSKEFQREHVSTLAGIHAYSKSLDHPSRSSALLRRSIHRIEKGLIMRPRRNTFAADYIKETVDIFVKAQQVKNFDTDELKWAMDVLETYFSVVGDTDTILLARQKFINNIVKNNKNKYIPYSYNALDEHKISYEQLRKLFLKRRAVRWYKDQIISEDLIKKAVNLASLAPSACNRQPFRFYVSSNKQKAVEIAKCVGGTSGWAEGIPCTIAIIGDLSLYPKEKDRHLIYIDSSLAAMQLMLAFETLGLATCSINWPDVNEAENKLRKIVKLQSFERPIMLMSVGYPDEQGGIPYSQKKSDRLLIQKV